MAIRIDYLLGWNCHLPLSNIIHFFFQIILFLEAASVEPRIIIFVKIEGDLDSSTHRSWHSFPASQQELSTSARWGGVFGVRFFQPGYPGGCACRLYCSMIFNAFRNGWSWNSTIFSPHWRNLERRFFVDTKDIKKNLYRSKFGVCWGTSSSSHAPSMMVAGGPYGVRPAPAAPDAPDKAVVISRWHGRRPTKWRIGYLYIWCILRVSGFYCRWVLFGGTRSIHLMHMEVAWPSLLFNIARAEAGCRQNREGIVGIVLKYVCVISLFGIHTVIQMFLKWQPFEFVLCFPFLSDHVAKWCAKYESQERPSLQAPQPLDVASFPETFQI